jgi:hypothetical protein
MSSVNSVTWTWPADVLAFAREQGIESSLGPLRTVAQAAFPALLDMRVSLQRDRDAPFGQFLAWEVIVPASDKDTYLEQVAAWYRDYAHALPSESRHLVSLFVVPVKA